MNTKQIIAMWVGVVVFVLISTDFVNAFDRRIAYLVCTVLATLALIVTLKDRQGPTDTKEQE